MRDAACPARRRPGRGAWSGRSAPGTPAASDRAGRSRGRSASGRAAPGFFDLVDVRTWEHHAAFGMVRVRQRQEARRDRRRRGVISSGVIAASCSHVMPAGSLTRTPSCTALPRDIVTPAQPRGRRGRSALRAAACVPRGDRRVGGLHARHGGGEGLLEHDRHVAGGGGASAAGAAPARLAKPVANSQRNEVMCRAMVSPFMWSA